MALRKNTPKGDSVSLPMKPLNFSRKLPGNVQIPDPDIAQNVAPNIDLDLREVYFLMLHLLSSGPCQQTYALLRHELLEHELLPRRYHAWYSRSGLPSGDDNDDGNSFPLNYTELAKRYSHVKKDHLVELLKQLVFVSNRPNPSRGIGDGNKMIGAGVPTLLGTGSFSLLSSEKEIVGSDLKAPPIGMRWPHMHADQVRGISLREIGGGFGRHHRAPSIRAACYVIAKPSSMVQKMQNIKRLRGHRNAVYCAILDRSGRYVITGSDDRLVKVWSMDTAYCLASCRGHEGDITDLAVSSNNIFIASASNDCVIRVWRLPDGLPVSVLRGHTGAVTAIAFSPRPGSPYQLLSSSDDGTCRIWDARGAQFAPRIYVPRPPSPDGKNSGPSSSNAQQSHQIFCCAFNANGSVFVTGSSDTLARVYSVWSANKTNTDDPEQPNHEMDVLAGHENDVNYVQFSGCAAGSKFSVTDYSKDENVPKFKNSWFCHDNIVTCSRDGSAIIWIPRSRRSHGKSCRWTRAYHLKVPPPPMPPQPPRGGPRQRILPTPRGVNMIAWSLDNRFVLAAIMDCRICVWNASDGSLVHSLTGHTASTYVMDVHPFNPRIAMSAGYDGKTIVWDIWEGIPIQIYEISHYKLVDGKFSPDGTSIILSDDVGQLYILSTGQGDSQKDAKYDQFFLGDYRPLIQDIYGNVLDQESQLQPYRRNMEDPLCDSGMIPYEEPYQTTFQKRRLGALGKEWRPSSLKLAVGPDITLDQDYQMPPLADLDLAEPLPEFIDVMEWEPEVDILSDENDSEYNVPEEYSSGKEQECLNSSTSGESGSSSGESAEDDNHQNSLRRSKRKKEKKEAGIMTSSGRRVKKRNFDELEGAPSNKKRTRKSRSGRKESKRKSSKSKSSRPRRAAARNALSWFSKITGTSKDAEEEEVSELSDSSESESSTQDSGTGDSELEVALLNGHGKQSKGKNILVCDSDDGAQQCDIRETHPTERRRLVLRFPVRNSDKLTLLENLPGSSSDVPTPTLGNGCAEDSRIPGNLEIHTNQFEGLDVSKVKWGMVKARTTKRIRGEAISSHELMGSDPEGKENNLKEDANHHGNGVTAPSCLELKTDIDGMAVDTDTVISNGLPNGGKRYPELDGSPSRLADDRASNGSQDVTGHRHNLIDSLPPISTTLRIRSKRVSRALDTSLRQEGKPLSIDQETGCSDALNDGFEDAKCDLALDCQKDGVVGTEISLRNDCVLEFNPQISDALSIANDVPVSHSHPKRMFDFVYRRKSRKHKTNLDRDAAITKEISPGSCSQDQGSGSKSHEGASNGFHGTQLNGLEKSEGSLTHIQDKISDSRGNQNSQEELRSASGATLRLRSTRNRKSTYPFSETKPIETKKPQQLIENVSWLTLSIHEEGSRYIPQMGDEVAYLRQGHQEYLNFSSLREVAPWTSIKGGNIKAVEICKVESLEYATLPGSGDSCCKMILKVIDPNSEVFNKAFKLTLPEVVTFPDFLVERSRYEAAIQRNWTCRDKCKVWWRDEGEEDGSWWEGRILAVKPKSPDFPDSPWERYTVKYKSDPAETHLHSPWELFDADTKWEPPHIDDEKRNRFLSALTKLETSDKRTQDSYGLRKLNQTVGNSSYTNRFPVPLSLDVIRSRLENNYYRSVEALRHDVAVMLSNAETFFGRNKSVAAKISNLSNWFDRTLPSS
ncbi:WD40 repeat [Arabidopsis thaliana x Arabidopsis arenosa]|uniref:WD40 repeat n=1 Tax=Arabidopsis thaliana x Arabidopsis arenosa TaxID=1240361 RepID=A0A8T1XHE9_9BRAS|nr:WD40 repeat [Arabidopsis thaliana x Arabidopsis arenosa]